MGVLAKVQKIDFARGDGGDGAENNSSQGISFHRTHTHKKGLFVLKREMKNEK